MLSPVYRRRALFDLESLVVYIGEVLKSPQAARGTYASIKNAVALLCEVPDLGRPFNDETLERSGYRTYLAGNYRIFYTHDDETLTIWRVTHTRQDIDDYALVPWGD